jgi:ankyrin repeat protein
MAVDKDGRTPLHAAVQGGLGYVKFLVDRGADVKAADKDGRTPLHDAARAGSVGAVRLLLDKGADVKAADKDGRTPLYAIVALVGGTSGISWIQGRFDSGG